jgi:ribokinase
VSDARIRGSIAGSIVVAGNLSLDDTITPAGTYPAAPGGDALYSCLGVRAWGGTPRLLTLVGDDYPQDHLDRIAAAGIDISRIRSVAGPTVHYRVTYAPDGSRVFEWISSEERLALTSPTGDDYAPAIAGAAWLHLAAMPIDAQEAGAAAARAAGVPLSIDPHEEYVLGFEDRLAAIVPASVFMPSELEARLLFPDLADLTPIPFALAAAERLDAWHPEIVALKLGELGSVVRWRGHSEHVPAPVVDVIDPTGAGDAYCGGFVAAWIASASPVVAAACGTVAASEIIGAYGAFSDAPDRGLARRLEEVEEMLAGLRAGGPAAADHAVALGRLRATLGRQETTA